MSGIPTTVQSPRTQPRCTQSVNQAFEVGASDVISKPYNLAIVRQR